MIEIKNIFSILMNIQLNIIYFEVYIYLYTLILRNMMIY